jgi:EAL domain-containing protein (putative c-di-GMP-specific phosphodiesterase class I)
MRVLRARVQTSPECWREAAPWRWQVRSVYQPIVELDSGEIVGYEALARGPAGTTWERPDALFSMARALGFAAELERDCHNAALEGALRSRLDVRRALFVNVEPSLLGGRGPDHLCRLIDGVRGRLQIVLELTERELTEHPARLLGWVSRVRRSGVRVALDDVGADLRSLALMSRLAPDVIKLDLRMVQSKPSDQIAAIVRSVGRQAERTGASIVAEGIETHSHRQRAIELGARYGQGWLFGRPGPLVSAPPAGERARGRGLALAPSLRARTRDVRRPLHRAMAATLSTLS